MKAKKKSWLTRLASIFFRPKHFFTRIVADGKIEDAMLNAFLWGLIGGILVLVTNLIRGDVFTIYSIFKAIVIYPVLAVMLLFIFAGLMMLVSEIASGDRDWEIAVKGIASIFFIYPLALLLNAFVFDCVSMWTVSIIIDLYMAFLLYNIAVYCMHGKRVSVMFVVAVCLGLLACLYMSDYKTVWILIKNLDAYSICMF